MIIPLDVKCTICSKTFCCAKCRRNHELKIHPIDLEIQSKCPICNKRPYILEKLIADNDLFEHVMAKHLPLACNKCDKVFSQRSELTDGLMKCECIIDNNNKAVILTTSEVNKENLMCGGDASPFAANKVINGQVDVNEILTPLSKWNLKWGRKSNEFHTNVSSIKRTASTSSLLHSHNKTGNSSCVERMSPKVKKLARSTSTPMHQMMFVQKSVTFDSILAISSCQMSTIDDCALGNDSESNERGSPSASKFAPPIVPKNRTRGSVYATPLRLQLMSKSVQRAMAAQGKYEQYYKSSIQRKMMFDSGSSNESSSTDTSPTSGSPLDLRTTPVLRRTKSVSAIQHERPIPIVKLTNDKDSELAVPLDDSPVFVMPAITVGFVPHPRRRSADFIQHMTSLPESDASQLGEGTEPEIYETCEDIEQQPTNGLGYLQKTASLEVLYITPRPVGGLMKKAISFATPEQMSVAQSMTKNESVNDLWYTPTQSSPTWARSRSCSTLMNELPESSDSDYTSSMDDVFHPNTYHSDSNTQPKPGRLWNIVTSVFRLASGGGSMPNIGEMDKKPTVHEPKTIAQRAASFAGFFCTQSNSESGTESPSKRRRTSPNGSTSTMNGCKSPKAKRHKRIQGRQPISRMRKSVR